MTTRRSISETLISCRNILLSDRTNEHVLPCLQQIVVDVNSIEISSSRKIVGRCVPEVIDQVRAAHFVSAGWILNLIHNLPLDEVSQLRWDVDYFLSIELPTFLEHFEEITSARLIAFYVCQQLACQYLPDAS
ncbi:hypothetical protein RAD15_42845 [Bradyrhizobium sp. 14AA]